MDQQVFGDLKKSFSECADTDQILEQQVFREKNSFGLRFFYQQSDERIEPETAGWEARTLPLCCAVLQ